MTDKEIVLQKCPDAIVHEVLLSGNKQKYYIYDCEADKFLSGGHDSIDHAWEDAARRTAIE